MKRLYQKFLLWRTRRRITSLNTVDSFIEDLKTAPDVPESVWGILYWRKYSLERKIETALMYLEQ